MAEKAGLPAVIPEGDLKENECGITCGDPREKGLLKKQMTVRCAHFHFCFSALLKQAWQGYKTKMPAYAGHLFLQRRGRDSNPR